MLSGLLIQIGKFLLAGLPAFLVAIPLNWVLVDLADIPKPLAYAFVLAVQITINFFMLRRYVFDTDRSVTMWSQFVKFFIGIAVFRLLDWALYTILVTATGVHYLIIQAGNVAIFSVAKFLFSKKVIEKRSV